jgi:hypothetical protein
LSIGDSPYVAPPLLFAFVSAAMLMREAEHREHLHAVRDRLRWGYLVVLSLLVGFAFTARASQYLSDEAVRIAGTDGLLSAIPENARAISLLAESIRRHGPADSLVVFPEGEVLNYLTGWRNPMRHKLYIPGYLSEETEPTILKELELARPGAIVVLRRFSGEYGHAYFGVHYGQRTLAWIERNYSLQSFDPHGTAGGALRARLFVRRQ